MGLEALVGGPCCLTTGAVYRATTSTIAEDLEAMFVVLTRRNYGFYKGASFETYQPTSLPRLR